MSGLLATLPAACATLAWSGVGLAQGRADRTEARQVQNQDGHAGQAALETDSQRALACGSNLIVPARPRVRPDPD